jgi:DNA-binding Lrp family transcriptional regulator
MPHNRNYDDLIIDHLYNNEKDSFNRIFDVLKFNSPGISKSTVSEHLKKMKGQGIIKKDDLSRRYNEIFYCLSGRTQSELRYTIFKGPKPRRKAVPSREVREIEKQNERNRKALLSLILQAAGGSARWKPVTGKPLPGCVAIPSSSSPRGSVMCSFEQETGVTMQDITEHRDVGNDEIFRHVNFAESTVDDFIRILKEDGLDSDSLQVIDRNNQEGKNDIGIKVRDENLKKLIDFIACLISSVEENIRCMWMYKKKPSKTNSWDLEWYESFYGRETTDRVLMEAIQKRAKIRREKNEGNKHEMMQYGEKLLRLAGRGVVGIYHCEIICDKYEYLLHDEKRRHAYEKYREFVREVINNGNHKYSHLIHDLVGLVYPESLRRLHEADSYLTEYVINLPDKPLNQWTNIPVS